MNQEKKLQFKIKNILLVLLALVLIGGGFVGGYWYGLKSKKVDILENEIEEKEQEYSLSGNKIIARNGDRVHSGTQYYSKIHIIADNIKGYQKKIHTFNDKADEKQEMEFVRFLRFDPQEQKILVRYQKRHDFCISGTISDCSLWDSEWLEDGIFNINLTTGLLEKVYDFKGNSYKPQSVVYYNDNKIVLFSEVADDGNAISVYQLFENNVVQEFITRSREEKWDLSLFPVLSFEIISARDLCFRLMGPGYAKADYVYDFESGMSATKCSEKVDQDDINFDNNTILSKIQEIEFGKID